MRLDVKQTIWFFSALALLMLLTRYNHFGSAVSMPDASLAVFFLAGIVFPALSRVTLVAFVILLLGAGAIDYYATQVQGVSDYCITPAYWFLIPAYASLWLGGSWFARRQQHGWKGWMLFAGAAWASTTVAFLVSNAGFFLFSGRIGDMAGLEYADRVSQYYAPYLASSFLYLAIAVAIYAAYQWAARHGSALDTPQH